MSLTAHPPLTETVLGGRAPTSVTSAHSDAHPSLKLLGFRVLPHLRSCGGSSRLLTHIFFWNLPRPSLRRFGERGRRVGPAPSGRFHQRRDAARRRPPAAGDAPRPPDPRGSLARKVEGRPARPSTFRASGARPRTRFLASPATGARGGLRPKLRRSRPGAHAPIN